MIGRKLLHMHSLKSCHLAKNNMKLLRCRYIINLISSILRKLNINSVNTVPNKRASISITLVTFRHERVKKVNPSAPTSQNGQANSSNSSAVADKLFERVWPFCRVGAQMIKNLLDFNLTGYWLGLIHIWRPLWGGRGVR